MLEQIIPKFPHEINRFIDMFGGGFNVGINAQAKTIIYNDTIGEVVELLKTLYIADIESILWDIDNLIEKYQLSKINQSGYLELREFYNKNKSSIPSGAVWLHWRPPICLY